MACVTLLGSGRDGRVTKEDLLAYMKSAQVCLFLETFLKFQEEAAQPAVAAPAAAAAVTAPTPAAAPLSAHPTPVALAEDKVSKLCFHMMIRSKLCCCGHYH